MERDPTSDPSVGRGAENRRGSPGETRLGQEKGVDVVGEGFRESDWRPEGLWDRCAQLGGRWEALEEDAEDSKINVPIPLPPASPASLQKKKKIYSAPAPHHHHSTGRQGRQSREKTLHHALHTLL